LKEKAQAYHGKDEKGEKTDKGFFEWGNIHGNEE